MGLRMVSSFRLGCVRVLRGSIATCCGSQSSARMSSTIASHRLPQQEFVLLGVDFDSTLTCDDTIRTLGAAAAWHRSGSSPSDAAAAAVASNVEAALPSAWLELERQYMDEREEFLGVALADRSSRAEFDPDAITTFIESLQHLEESATARATEAGVLRGLRRDRLLADLRGPLRPTVALRPGSGAALRGAVRAGARLGIISVNWCPELISSALEDASLPASSVPSGAWLASDGLEWDAAGVATGRIEQRVVGGMGKRRVLREMRKKLTADAQAVADQTRGGLSYYVGDSVTDLLALLDADIGIVIGTSSSLRRVARAFSIEIVPLPATLNRELLPQPGLLYEASEWTSIAAFFGWSLDE